MPIRNTVTHYGSVAKFFHWVIAIFVIYMIPLGFLMGGVKTPTLQNLLFAIHKSSGLTILFLLILRYLWRLSSTRPKFPADMPVWQAKMANWSHKLLYLLIFIQPLSGWVMTTASSNAPSFWWIVNIPAPWVTPNKTVADVAGFIHHYCAWVIVGAVSLHIIGALEHWIIRRDGVFQRMLPNSLKKKQFYDE